MKIAFFSTKPYDKDSFERYNSVHQIEFYEVALNEHSVRLAEGSEAVCVFVNDHLNATVISKLKKLGIKLVALRCAGFNNVDLQAAAHEGVRIVRVPAYSPYAVAEHALALVMTLNRKTHKAYNRVREGNFSLEKLTGFDLYRKTVGVVGTGKIGGVFARIMLGLGCKVLAYDQHNDVELITAGVTYVPFDELLAEADILSLHCPLLDTTRHLINEGSLAKMKRGMMLINTSRGGLIDTHAVVEALKNKIIGYLGIDVYEQEENIFFNDLSEQILQDDTLARLMTFPNVIITSHQGFLTEEALTQIALVTLQNISDFEHQKPLANEVK
ncbi:2-hydroxyacid dehydrogenase [Emticicia sp. 21SJ11W-3]|uniref:2-hydroxyacid dehydrogenase n=1 Tax=Emticicia sp. 21SJ11W-3 TaxID=2916755 RepID=UPI00209CFD0C|nr:2-hydroxyacid dehydrogenase [Emticicia sp. 21SJ11W-3]UTA68773.1 2-hydroxyacid dehydrogenase [Emticicia sp. 21SJ11W-3]